MKQFDIVTNTSSSRDLIGVILIGPIEIPYFEDGCASNYAFDPLDVTNPNEWGQTFVGYIVFNLLTNEYEVRAEQMLEIFDHKDPLNGYIPFDQGTARLRSVLGLIKLGNVKEFLEKNLK